MIKIKHYEDRFYPAIECDGCGKEIKKAEDGSCLFKVSVEKIELVDGEIFFLHKDCCKPFERSHEGRWHWSWMPLGKMLEGLFPAGRAESVEK